MGSTVFEVAWDYRAAWLYAISHQELILSIRNQRVRAHRRQDSFITDARLCLRCSAGRLEYKGKFSSVRPVPLFFIEPTA